MPWRTLAGVALGGLLVAWVVYALGLARRGDPAGWATDGWR